MGWTDLCQFVVNSNAVNLLKTFAVVPLEIIVNRMNVMRISAAVSPTATQAATGSDTTVPNSSTLTQISIFKIKGMFTYILNSCDKELQI